MSDINALLAQRAELDRQIEELQSGDLKERENTLGDILAAVAEWATVRGHEALRRELKNWEYVTFAGIEVGVGHDGGERWGLPQSSVTVMDSVSGTDVEFGTTPPPVQAVLGLLEGLLATR
ncbi:MULTISPECIES: hypothetical protein [unclassified Streptosporangium]|uniref:hypothetical protein n=1 Tax=unclassified Streptosporangium TaxID=2632669 RepID=UPI002E29D1EE|nr:MULTISPECIES: hypothetical protein [unclassified Streptosporangium]